MLPKRLILKICLLSKVCHFTKFFDNQLSHSVDENMFIRNFVEWNCNVHDD